jgi:hypothetical protein
VKLRTDGLTWREIEGETVLLDLKSSKYLRTNRTGSFLLKQLATECSADELADSLRDEYALTDDQATQDVASFVRILTDRGLLEKSPA